MSDYFKTHTADEIIDKAWHTFVPKGVPESRYNLKNFKKGLDKASQKENLSNTTKSRIQEGYNYIKKWKKRRFVGSYWLLIISILSVAWFGYQMYGRYKAGEPVLLLETGGTKKALLANAFGFFYLFGFITYFWSQRAPSWMVYTHGLRSGDNSMEIALKPNRYILYDKQGNTIKDRFGKTNVYESTDYFSVIVVIVLKYLTLPFFTFIGFLRYYVFYI